MESRDWSVCMICGVGSGELRCLADSLQNKGIEIYDTFLKLVDEFRWLNALPSFHRIIISRWHRIPDIAAK